MSTFDIQKINKHLQAFRANPVEMMKKVPPKFDTEGREVIASGPFGAEDYREAGYSSGRDQIRTGMIAAETTRAAYAANDNPRNLVDTFTHETLTAIEAAGLKAARLDEQPWSGDYWATAQGGLGNRYVACMPYGWQESFDYIRNHPSRVILHSGSDVWVNELSPAEKYDALVGDANETLTRASWQKGKAYFDAHDDVPGWFGICHGWSPASFMLPRPKKSVKVQTPDGISLTFFPCEIKALGSLLWAESHPQVRFIGGRCNTENPAFDLETGRVVTLNNPYMAAEVSPEEPLPPDMPPPGEVEVTLSTEHWNEETGEIDGRTGGRSTEAGCFDTNPGSWHLSIVNQIGVSRRSMVMDASFDYQVWNQPLLGYEYTYFNPHTLQTTDVLQDATVSRANFTSDIFKKYRSPKAASFVGVIMKATYMGENGNEQVHEDTPDNDSVIDVYYYYDLELDSSGKIIGGEWYTNSHPDFLWTPRKGTRAASRYEQMTTGTWQAGQPVPESWRAAAQKASADLTPLAAVVEQLFKMAQ